MKQLNLIVEYGEKGSFPLRDVAEIITRENSLMVRHYERPGVLHMTAFVTDRVTSLKPELVERT